MQLLYVTEHQRDHWLIQALLQMGHAVEVADWGLEAAEVAREDGYDLILADMARPSVEAARPLFTCDVPVVVVADAADPAERAAILRAGADACLTRPLHLLEVEVRLSALLRATDRRRDSVALGAGIHFDRMARAIAVEDRWVELSPTEFRMMTYLYRRAGSVVEPALLDRHLAGYAADPRPDRVRSLVSRLRRKLQAALGESLIHTVPGHGYVLRYRRSDPDAP